MSLLRRSLIYTLVIASALASCICGQQQLMFKQQQALGYGLFGDPCSPSPCQNGGGCVALSSTQYTCNCPLYYGGKNCSIFSFSYMGCSSLTCQNNGFCVVATDANRYCICPNGYTGQLCEQYIGGCYSSPCQNGGVCLALPGLSFSCTCSSSFTGSLCNIKITSSNACQASTPVCLNGGLCVPTQSNSLGYLCVCSVGYTGNQCQIASSNSAISSLLISQIAETSSSLHASTTSPSMPTLTSMQSLPLPSSCQDVQCQNGGTCQVSATSGLASCVCPANIYGSSCQYAVTSATCQAGDTSKLCASWKKLGFCTFAYTYQSLPIPIICPNTCSLCSQLSTCEDTQPSCAIWANLNMCNKIPDPNLCKLSCNLCGSLAKKK